MCAGAVGVLSVIDGLDFRGREVNTRSAEEFFLEGSFLSSISFFQIT